MEKITDEIAALRDEARESQYGALRAVATPRDTPGRAVRLSPVDIHRYYAERLDALLARCGKERLMYETPQGDMVDYEPPPRWPRRPHHVIKIKEPDDG